MDLLWMIWYRLRGWPLIVLDDVDHLTNYVGGKPRKATWKEEWAFIKGVPIQPS